MTLWNTFHELERMRRDFDRLFEANNSVPFSGPRRLAFLPGIAARQYPMINLYEDRDYFDVEALAPGINPDRIDLNITGNLLTISGEKTHIEGEVKPEAFHRSERAAGRFVRSLELPSEVNGDHVSAEYKNGILTIHIPKAEKTKPRSIQVKMLS